MEEVAKRRPVISAKERGPGPGRYALPPTVGYVDHDVTKPSGPAYSFRTRMSSTSDKFQTPGPGTYSPEKAPPLNAQRRPPAYTMGARTRYRSVDAVPAPNSYTLPKLLGNQVPDKASAVSYSMSARRPSVDLAQSPGPGGYNSTHPDVYLRRQPSFSMRSRTERPTYPSATPGPGAYRPERSGAHLRRAPSFTMGVRHSEFVTPLVLDFGH
ncbi:outer dense fiber protein 3-like protein 2a isoform X3 [Phyllopteryx taeniolatus]|uniref:outer dense fiber protein 3-like protein 2a isoform X3 n=1 Tax=Phyllopteryx taeniolatus TaxID=161469 RepID=UPI002AD3AE9F|nr:outer dense fiber protein 3-like protein 2a isoform X3 [Phyllopteryx taeniolatus]